MHLGQVRHAFARNFEGKENVKIKLFLAPAWLSACKSQCVHLGVESCKTLNVYHSVYLLLLVYVQHSLQPPVVHMQLHPSVTPEGPTPGGLLLGALWGFPWRLLRGSLFI